MERIETQRMILRPWTPADAEDLFAYASDPRVGPAAGWKPHESLAESRQILENFITADETLALELRETGRVIGSVGLHRRSPAGVPDKLPCRELGYVMHPDCWGHGYMAEAVRACLDWGFEALELDHVWGCHARENTRSQKVLLRCGMEPRFSREVESALTGKRFTEDWYWLTRQAWQETVFEEEIGELLFSTIF